MRFPPLPGLLTVARFWLGGVLLLFSQRCFAVSVPIRVERTNAPLTLTVGPMPVRGAVFLWGASDLSTLTASPVLVFQTNAPVASEFRVTIPTNTGFGERGFFTSAQWTNLAPVMVQLPAGNFVMGTPPSEPEQSAWEGPQTGVTLSRAFAIGRYEVTQGEYQALTGAKPSYFTGDTNRPVEQVSWGNATNYCARLTQALRGAGCLPPGWACRLPTEAEWEYACRAGTTTAFCFGPALLSGMANFDGRQEYDATAGTVANPSGVFLDRTASVYQGSPNAWGVAGTHGNVWEWCQDWWGYNLPGGNVTDPQGPATGTQRVLRGGGYYSPARACRSGYRSPGLPDYTGNEVGFRVVLAPAGQ